jgi:hypothetical protein
LFELQRELLAMTGALRVPWVGISCFVITTTFFVILGHQRYFIKPIFEDGDFAANSLRIAKAMEFREVHGNYSRWGFSHPGPAFFYVYAAGQYLLYNVLKICPEEHNAHLLTGVHLQAGFWSLAMGVLATHVRQRTTLLTIAGIGFIHFHFANQAFISPQTSERLLGFLV